MQLKLNTCVTKNCSNNKPQNIVIDEIPYVQSLFMLQLFIVTSTYFTCNVHECIVCFQL